jgi:hypothetical protein
MSNKNIQHAPEVVTLNVHCAELTNVLLKQSLQSPTRQTNNVSNSKYKCTIFYMTCDSTKLLKITLRLMRQVQSCTQSHQNGEPENMNKIQNI